MTGPYRSSATGTCRAGPTFEPGKLGPTDPEEARYDASSQTAAAFLAYLAERYDPGLVRTLNAVIREEGYTDEVWKGLTGKSLPELEEEWRSSLR